MVIHPPMLYLGYTGFYHSVRVCARRAAGPLSRREMDSHHAPLDHDRLGLPERRHSAGRALGLRRARLGRLLGLGPGRKCVAAAVAYRHGVSALGDDAGKARHDESVERVAGLHHVHAVHPGHVADAHGRGQFRARLRAIDHRHLVRGFLAIIFVVCFAAYWKNRDYLRSDNQLDSLVSRESSFLFNNLILLAACFAVLSGTLFPVLSEWVRGSKISVGAPFFNKVNMPIALFLLFLTGVGPLLAWRKTSFDALKRNFAWPLGGGVLAGIIAFHFRLPRFLLADLPDPFRVRDADDCFGILPRRARDLRARWYEPAHLPSANSPCAIPAATAATSSTSAWC